MLPERGQVTMAGGFLAAYSLLLIQTCHRRGAFAMGGMAAQIPIKADAAANEVAMAKVRADKEREAGNGHDGTWVAHPALVPIAQAIFDRHMPQPNQLDIARADVSVSAHELLLAQAGSITEVGLRGNVNIALQYLAAWLGGSGCVPIHNLMEDAATAEISRAQLWQWRKHAARLDDGRVIDTALIEQTLANELAGLLIHATPLQHHRLVQAERIFRELVLAPTFAAFLTLPAYAELITAGA
jgi:malate synthase